MLTLGILETTSSTYEKISQEFETEQYHLKKIEHKEQVKNVDGLIIPLEMKEQLGQAVEWLVACQQFSAVFIWVISNDFLDYEESILLDLGVNAVIKTEEKEFLLKKIVKNTFKRIENSKPYRNNNSSEFSLNDENQSIIVKGDEQLLTVTEFRVMKFLYKNKNKTISYDEIMPYMWPGTSSENIYKLTNIIFHIRKKLNKNAPCSIKTIRSIGYRLELENECSE